MSSVIDQFQRGADSRKPSRKTGPRRGGTLPGPFAPSIYAKHGKEEGDVKINKDPASPSAGLAKMELQTPRVGLRVPPQGPGIRQPGVHEARQAAGPQRTSLPWFPQREEGPPPRSDPSITVPGA